ncbi:MAG TPA: hypothetical protein VGT43_04040 [Burkholderiales bacterium]|nr:hypothetical protein [Burkholderiales bacterium]
MRALIVSLSQVAVMGAIVALLLYALVGIVLALVFALFGVSLETVVTFDDTLSIYAGLFAWWLLTFSGTSVYAFCAFPWEEKVLAWPRKN